MSNKNELSVNKYGCYCDYSIDLFNDGQRTNVEIGTSQESESVELTLRSGKTMTKVRLDLEGLKKLALLMNGALYTQWQKTTPG